MMCDRVEPISNGELGNNNRRGVAAGDTNANNVPTESRKKTADTCCLSELVTETAEQDRVIIWGTDSQCDDPELAEFEMLECQELEAYLVKEGEDFVGLTERSSCSEIMPRQVENKIVLEAQCQQDHAAFQMSKEEFSSENGVFLTSQSGTLSGASATPAADSWHQNAGCHSAPSKEMTPSSQTCSRSAEKCNAAETADQSSSVAKNSSVHHVDLDANFNSMHQIKGRTLQAKMENGVACNDVGDRHKNGNRKSDGVASNAESDLSNHTAPIEELNTKLDKSTQADETPDLIKNTKSVAKATQSSAENKAFRKQGSFDNSLKKQNSFDRSFRKQPSFENGLKKQHSFDNSIGKHGSFENSINANTSSLERRKAWGSPSRPGTPQTTSPRRPPPSSPAKVQRPRPLSWERSGSPQRSQTPKPINKTSSGIPKPITLQQKDMEPQRPKNVRPKIITCVRKNTSAKPQDADAQLQASLNTTRNGVPQSRSSPVLTSSSPQFVRYRQETQKPVFYPPDKPPNGTVPQRLNKKSESFHEDMSTKRFKEEGGSVYRAHRTPRPQLGFGAVTKTKVQQVVQRTAPPSAQSPAGRAPTPRHQEQAGFETTPRSVLLKPGQSGLRPPGFSSLPAARLAALGFIRSSSVTSVSSSVSNDSSHSDHLQPLRTELQKDIQSVFSPRSSPKRCAVVSPKPQSGARGSCITAPALGAGRTGQELDRAVIQHLQERCEQQALQLQSLQSQLKKASLCLDVFSVATQHFSHKSETAIVREKELSLELARIRDEVAFSVGHWEQLQQEKRELERRFEAELQEQRAQQTRELGALEDRLKAQHKEETESLQVQQRAEMAELRSRQQDRLEEVNEKHEASLVEMETSHNDALATLQEEHARTVKNLKMAHEQQRKSLTDEFEKIRLSLQDQVDTLTFQNRSLRDRAKRFEEALRKSTDEQIVDALAPYKHIEEDLKSLKEVLEMKNQQIHHQELKISELEKIAEKNVHLEERLQVLQQQNEDLKEQIDKNVAMSRQLSEQNANLQVHVEMESKEKKRLSRTNEELLWRLQTGELSPHMTPTSSPVHLPPPGPGSPARPHSYHQ